MNLEDKASGIIFLPSDKTAAYRRETTTAATVVPSGIPPRSSLHTVQERLLFRIGCFRQGNCSRLLSADQ